MREDQTAINRGKVNLELVEAAIDKARRGVMEHFPRAGDDASRCGRG